MADFIIALMMCAGFLASYLSGFYAGRASSLGKLRTYRWAYKAVWDKASMISAASVTYEGDVVGAWYFDPIDRAPPPYTKQIKVTAIVDVADDGTFAGLEVIDARMPPPFIVKQAAVE